MTSDLAGLTVDELADRFDVHRPRLLAIATRTLGSGASAEDAVQESWLRLQRSDYGEIDHLQAWLTTVVSRVCIDLVRQRTAWRESGGDELSDAAVRVDETSVADPAGSALRSEDVALALSAILETLGPLERLALVLHDIFAMPYDDIAPIVERTPTAARQLASRARGRLRAADVDGVRERRQAGVEAFLKAARGGDFGALLQLLDPDIDVRSDAAAVSLAGEGAAYGAPLLRNEIRGGDAVARAFVGRAELTSSATIDGLPAAAYLVDGRVRAVYLIGFAGDRISSVEVRADEALLAGLKVVPAQES